MITYFSTRNDLKMISSAEAIVNGLAPDGGLYVPSDLSGLAVDFRSVIKEDYRGMAKEIFGKFFPDFGAENIDRIVERSYEGSSRRLRSRRSPVSATASCSSSITDRPAPSRT